MAKGVRLYNPLQTKQQYAAIKENLPLLWEILKRKADDWKTFGEKEGQSGIFYNEAHEL